MGVSMNKTNAYVYSSNSMQMRNAISKFEKGYQKHLYNPKYARKNWACRKMSLGVKDHP